MFKTHDLGLKKKSMCNLQNVYLMVHKVQILELKYLDLMENDLIIHFHFILLTFFIYLFYYSLIVFFLFVFLFTYLLIHLLQDDEENLQTHGFHMDNAVAKGASAQGPGFQLKF